MRLDGFRTDWRIHEVPSPAQLHECVFAVKQGNLERLTSELLAVSDPTSPRYGAHLDFNSVGALVKNPEATANVTAFLSARGGTIVKQTPHGEYIRVVAPVGVWNEMLDAEFALHNHATTGQQILRTTSYSIPAELTDHVAFISHTVELPPTRVHSIVSDQSDAVGKVAVGGVNPALISSFYEIGDATGSNASTIAVFEGDNANYSPSDLASFQSLYMLPPQKVAKVIGGHNLSATCNSNPQACGEADLDVQYAMAVAKGSPMTYMYIDNDTSPFVAWAEAVAADSSPALVHSISYGEIEQNMDRNLLEMFSIEAQKLGARGVTIVVASGDDGANSFHARQNKTACGLSASFPASCPYVLAVGATQGPAEYQPETAETSDKGGVITSGGGFSDFYAQPSWMVEAIASYLETVDPKPTGPFNSSMRGYPDVSMVGKNYQTTIGGFTRGVSGTSASAPVVAGMIALVNAERIKAGNNAIGFILPALYQNNTGSTVANDVTSGKNNCCAGQNIYSVVCCPHGYSASKGWDAVTGFGSINYKRFAQKFGGGT